MKILAIETSCDDTGIAVLEIKGEKTLSFNALSNIVSSQIKVHEKYGGVYPALAKREHQKNLAPVLEKSLARAGLLKISNSKLLISNKILNAKIQKIKKILNREPELEKKLISFLKKYKKPAINLIAVTNGPGLEPCLWVGINFAKALSYFWNIPIVPVNHIEAHILVNFLDKKLISNPVHKLRDSVIYEPTYLLFPAIALVVSGGHTQIILMKNIGKYKILGETRDDAAGECFDKCAKILGLGYPGGPIIAKLAEDGLPLISGSPSSARLPRPMINTKDYDFSFSGLKTAVLYSWQKINSGSVFGDRQKPYRNKFVTAMASEIQQAIIDVLIKKTIKAAKDYKAKTIILGGGVSANQELRKQFSQIQNFHIIFPEESLSTDNGLMTAITGFYHKKQTKPWRSIKAEANLRISK